MGRSVKGLSWDAGPESNVVSQDLVQEAVAAASLTDVLLKLTGEAGFSFLEPMIRQATNQRACFHCR